MKIISFLFLIFFSLVQANTNSAVNVEPLTKMFPPRNHYSKFLARPDSRITGGEEVVPNSIPYQVALFISKTDLKRYFCGGSLISRTCVLTASHCLKDATEIEVYLGAHNIQEEEPTQVRMVTTNFLMHEDYQKTSNDIGLVYLPTPASLNDCIQLVRLPTWNDSTNDFTGVNALQSGWGKTSDEAPGITDKLQSVECTIITKEACNSSFFGTIKNEHICTDTTGGKSVCNGDSGGPLCDENGTQIGIASFVIFFGCEVHWPAAFVRVTEFLGWIEQHSDVVIKK